MSSTIWNATKATAIAAILSEITTNFVGTDADGMLYIKRAELRDWMISEFSDVFADSAARPVSTFYMQNYFGDPPTEMDGILDRLVAAYEPETFKQQSSFPLSTASQSKDELINQISKLQVDAQRAAEAIVIHYEDRVANIRPAVEQWFAANVLNLKPTEAGGFPEGVTRVIDTRAYITTFVTLEPGDLLLTGTPAGVGLVRKPPVLLRDGDEFEVRIDGIGSLRNSYTAEKVG